MAKTGILKNDKFECKLMYILFGLSVLFLLNTLYRVIDLRIAISWLEAFNMVFLSILIQAIPFILIGILVSSILQIAIPSETIVKLFPQKKATGFIMAIFAGVFFPICDCAIVPVAARLIKKGVSLPVAITFMLSAPLVNPIVIASTLYAFPKQPSIAFFRVSIGILIAVIVGVIFLFFGEKKSILKRSLDNTHCCCDCSSNRVQNKMGVIKKLELIFMHASNEFFQVGKFLIIGAFFSSLFQVCISKEIFNNLGGHKFLSLLVMMLAAFVFSICSTSDAFIAKTFSFQFSTGAILGFLVLGPMIDIKNMLMLLASFKKSFVIKLITTIFLVTFLILWLVLLL